jgi:hypothetical protein
VGAQLEPNASISAEGARAVRVRLQGLNCHSGHRAQVEEALTLAGLMREAGSPTSLTKRKRGREATLNAWRNETTTARFNSSFVTPSVAARPIAPARGLSTSASLFYSLASCCRVRSLKENDHRPDRRLEFIGAAIDHLASDVEDDCQSDIGDPAVLL